MKITKIVRNKEICHTFDITTESGAFSLPNGCVSHNSSVVIDSTNGLELPKTLIANKESKAGVPPQVVPEYHKLKKYYQTMWDDKDNCDNYLKTCAVLQVYTDQGISANTFNSGKFYEDGKIPVKVVGQQMFDYFKRGGKSLYYDITDKQSSKDRIEKLVNDDLQVAQQNVSEDDDGPICEGCVL